MRNKFLTIKSIKFLYHCMQIDMKVKPKPLVRKMSEAEWELAQSQIEEIKMEQAVRSY